MPLNDFEKANFRKHTHTTDQIIDSETGDPMEDAEGLTQEQVQDLIDDAIDAIPDLPTLAKGRGKSTSDSTSSSTPANVSGMVVTITTGARRCWVAATMPCQGTAQFGLGASDLTIDDTPVMESGERMGLFQAFTSGAQGSMGFSWLTDALSAGEHVFRVRFWNDGPGTINVLDGATLSVAEQL